MKNKKLQRRKNFEKQRNLRNNNTPQNRYCLMVEGKPMMGFRDMTAVEGYIASIEDIRKRKASKIVPATIVEIKTMRLVSSIAGSD